MPIGQQGVASPAGLQCRQRVGRWRHSFRPFGPHRGLRRRSAMRGFPTIRRRELCWQKQGCGRMAFVAGPDGRGRRVAGRSDRRLRGVRVGRRARRAGVPARAVVAAGAGAGPLSRRGDAAASWSAWVAPVDGCVSAGARPACRGLGAGGSCSVGGESPSAWSACGGSCLRLVGAVGFADSWPSVVAASRLAALSRPDVYRKGLTCVRSSRGAVSSLSPL